MSQPIIDYHYAVLSPFSYLGVPALREIVARHDAKLVYKPADFFEVFKGSGGVPVHERAPQRQAYRLIELERWAKFRAMKLNLNPKFFPADQTRASLMVLAALSLDRDPGDLNFAYQRAVWAEERDIADPATVVAIADENGFAGDDLYTLAQSDAIRAQYAANTQEAIDLNLFGPPSYIHKGELFWGQDRLEFLDRALAG